MPGRFRRLGERRRDLMKLPWLQRLREILVGKLELCDASDHSLVKMDCAALQVVSDILPGLCALQRGTEAEKRGDKGPLKWAAILIGGQHFSGFFRRVPQLQRGSSLLLCALLCSAQILKWPTKIPHHLHSTSQLYLPQSIATFALRSKPRYSFFCSYDLRLKYRRDG